MANYFFGVNLIENLTTGMYQNSLVIFREYLQNSCDAIDKAHTNKFLAEGEDKINISIDKAAHPITIMDNGAGISVLDFKPSLTGIAASDKDLESDRVFRGIGRLCVRVYCGELRFVSTSKGEGIQSTMIKAADSSKEKIFPSAGWLGEEGLAK